MHALQLIHLRIYSIAALLRMLYYTKHKRALGKSIAMGEKTNCNSSTAPHLLLAKYISYHRILQSRLSPFCMLAMGKTGEGAICEIVTFPYDDHYRPMNAAYLGHYGKHPWALI